jgi:allantoin racemase
MVRAVEEAGIPTITKQEGISMKIYYVTPCSKEFAGGFAQVLESTTKRFARQGTEVACGWIAEGEQPFPTPTLHQFAEAANVVAMTKSIIDAEKAGYDAGIIGCFFDPGLYPARSVVNIPVTGPCESSVLFAHSLGFKYSIITLEDLIAPWIHENVRRYGLSERLGSVRGMGVTSEEAMKLYGDPEKLVKEFLKTSKVVLKEERIEVIIPGCTILSTILSAQNISGVDGVPIIDGVATSIKMAESLADLKQTCKYQVCRNGLYGREVGAPLSLPLRYKQ